MRAFRLTSRAWTFHINSNFDLEICPATNIFFPPTHKLESYRWAAVHTEGILEMALTSESCLVEIHFSTYLAVY